MWWQSRTSASPAWAQDGGGRLGTGWGGGCSGCWSVFMFLPSDLLHFPMVHPAEVALLFPANKHTHTHTQVQKGQNKQGFAECVWCVWACWRWQTGRRGIETIWSASFLPSCIYRCDLFPNAHTANRAEAAGSRKQLLITPASLNAFNCETAAGSQVGTNLNIWLTLTLPGCVQSCLYWEKLAVRHRKKHFWLL